MISIYSAYVMGVVILCILVSLLLIGYSPKNKKYNLYLASFFLLLAYPCFVLFLINTGFITSLPHVYRTGMIATLLYIPAAYLYVRTVATNKPLSKKDLLHLLPVILYIIDYFPYFFIPGSEKVAFMQSKELSKMVLYFAESKFFIPGFYIIFKYVLGFSYWVAQSVYLIKLYKVKNVEFKTENNVWLKWLTLFILSESFLFLPAFHILKPGYGDDEFTVFLFIGGFTGLTSIFLFAFPQILFGIKGTILLSYNVSELHDSNAATPIANEPIEIKNYSKYLSKTKMVLISNKVKEHIIKNQSYLDKLYKLQQLAVEIQTPAQYISASINECEKTNFNDFINKYRINHCVTLLQNLDYQNQTLEAIANESGFNNRNTFTVAFKKTIGKTPSDYIKKIKKDTEFLNPVT
ncbi:helix-turn-helix domain-containing protein [Flavobacterium aquidurense]|uniref:helix-turn-helix domain-containing protein n=1 Tax=Flavobacterium aquidurense TaxID=362413 RepID=UPI00371DE36A